MAQVFISYSRKDKEFVQRLADALAAQKREAWVDWKDIAPTAEWQREILTNIEAADNFIFVIGPESAASPNCRKEIDHAVANHKRMVPIFHRPVADEAIPEALGRFQRIDFGDDDHFDSKFAALIAALDTDLAWVQTHTRLLTRAKEWEREGKDSSFVLRGKDLNEAEQWVAKSAEKEPKPTTLHSQYILASRQAETKSQRRRISVAVGVAVLAVILASWAVSEASKALNGQAMARKQGCEAEEERKEAEENRNNAEVNANRASCQEGNANVEAGIAKKNAREAQIELARSATNNAEDAMNAKNRPDQALAYAAYALGVDPDSIVAKNWVSDLLLRKSWWLPHDALHHAGEIDGAAVSADGQRVVTRSGRTVRVWEIDSGKPAAVLMQHEGDIGFAALSPDGRRIVVTASEHMAQVWNVDTGQPAGPPLQTEGFVMSVTFGADEPYALALSGKMGERTVEVWEADTGKRVGVPIQIKDVVISALSSEGRRLVTSSGTTTQVWEVSSGKPVGVPLETKGLAEFVTLSSNGQRVAVTSGNQVLLWEVDTGVLIGSPLQHKWPVNSAAFSADGRRMVTASGPTAQVWDVDTGKPVGAPLQHKNAVFSAVFNADGRRLVTASGNVALIWDQYTAMSAGTPLQSKRDLYFAAFSADGSRLVTSSPNSTAQVWQAETGDRLGPPMDENGNLSCVAMSGNGRRVVIVAGDKAQVREADSGKLVTAPVPERNVEFGALSADGRRLVTASGSGTVRVWQVDSGRPVGKPFQRAGLFASLTFDGQRVVTVSADGAQVWEVDTGKPVGDRMLADPSELLHSAEVSGRHPSEPARPFAVFSRDGRRVLTASGRTVQVWEVDTGKPLAAPMQDAGDVYSAAFSPDGRVITVSGYGAQVWDANTGKPVGDLLSPDHSESFRSAVFSRDGWRVLTVSGYRVQVWEVILGSGSTPDAVGLSDLAELASGYRLNEFASVTTVGFDERLEMVRKLRQKYKVPPQENVLAWLLRRLSASKPAGETASSGKGGSINSREIRGTQECSTYKEAPIPPKKDCNEQYQGWRKILSNLTR